MKNNITFLELKFGNIYGGYANFFAISDITLLVFEPSTNKVFIETLSINADVDVVWVNSKTNEFGHTVGRTKQVVNLRTRRKKVYKEDFELDERSLDYAFRNIRPSRRFISNFFRKNFQKYRIRDIVTFDGKRDIFLCEKSGVDFRGKKIFDLQKALNKEFNYLFSLNKLAVAIDFRFDTHLRSHNLEYWIHPIAARQIMPKSAAWDAARMFMVYQEYNQFHQDFTLKSALLVNQIQSLKEEEAAALEKEEAAKAKAEAEKKVVEKVEITPPSSDEAAVEESEEEVKQK